MTPARRPNPSPHTMPYQHTHSGDMGLDASWPTVFRALLLLTDAAHPADPTLARLADDDLAQLRAALARLTGDEPTSAA